MWLWLFWIKLLCVNIQMEVVKQHFYVLLFVFVDSAHWNLEISFNFDLALLRVKVLITVKWNGFFLFKSCSCNNKLEWSHPKGQTKLLFVFFCWACSFLCWFRMGSSPKSLSILYLDSVTSEFEKINYVCIYIYIYMCVCVCVCACVCVCVCVRVRVRVCVCIYIYIYIYIYSLVRLWSHKEYCNLYSPQTFKIVAL